MLLVLAIFTISTIFAQELVPSLFGAAETYELNFTILPDVCDVYLHSSSGFLDVYENTYDPDSRELKLTNIGTNDIIDITVSATNWLDSSDKSIFPPSFTIINSQGNNIELANSPQSLNLSLAASEIYADDGENAIITMEVDLRNINDVVLDASKSFRGDLKQIIIFVPHCKIG